MQGSDDLAMTTSYILQGYYHMCDTKDSASSFTGKYLLWILLP